MQKVHVWLTSAQPLFVQEAVETPPAAPAVPKLGVFEGCW